MAKIRFVAFDVPNTTGNFDVTGTFGGETPVAVLFIATNHRSANDPNATVHAVQSAGAATSTTEQWAVSTYSRNNNATTYVRRAATSSSCLVIVSAMSTSSALWEAAFVQFIPNGVRLNFTQASTESPARVLAVFFFGMSAKAGTASVTGGGVSGLPFQPNVVFAFTHNDNIGSSLSFSSFFGHAAGCAVDVGTVKQRGMGRAEGNYQSVGNPYIGFDSVLVMQQDTTSASIDWTLSLTGFTADGWTTSYTGSPGTDKYGYLALRIDGVPFDLVEFQEPAAAGAQQITLGFSPDFALAVFGAPASVNSSGGPDASGMSYGAFDAGGQAYATAGMKYNADLTYTNSDLKTGKFFSHYRQGVKAAEATASAGGTGLDLSWSSVTGAQERGWLFAVGPSAPPGGGFPPILPGAHSIVVT